MTTQDKTRSDFEAHAKRNGLCIDRAPCQRGVSEKYWSAQTQHTWEGWKAACQQQYYGRKPLPEEIVDKFIRDIECLSGLRQGESNV